MLVGIEPEKERRDCFPEKSSTTVRTYSARTLSCRGQTDEGVAKHRKREGQEEGGLKGVKRKRVTNSPSPHDTSPAMLVDPRYSIETEHYSFIVSPLRPRMCVYVCVCVSMCLYSCCPMAHEDFVVCQLRHLQRAFGRHADTHTSTIVRKGIVMPRRTTPRSYSFIVKSTRRF